MNNNETNISTEVNEDQLRNIYYVSFLLRQKLVPDVVPSILHHAGLFAKHTYSTGSVAQPLVVTHKTAPSTCLVTLPIRSPSRALNPVRKVVFNIQSCDQGWKSQRNDASWTWFTAGVILKQNPFPELESVGMLDYHGLDPQASNRNDKFLDQEREILRNETASSVSRTHIVQWTADSENEDERKWVSALGNGDKIAVRGWALYPGWENRVRVVSVTVYTTVII